MTDLRRPWRVPLRGGRILAALAVIVSLVAAGAIALASSSPPQLTARGTPLPLPSTPVPTVPAATPTTLGASPASGLPASTSLDSVGPSELVALSPTGAAVSTKGSAWTDIPVPAGTTGLAIDRSDPNALLAGGARVQSTTDGGGHWVATPAQPASTGPFVPLLISPWDSRVLFVAHQDLVAVSTDGGSTWHDVGVPRGAQPVMTSGNAPGTFFLAVGTSVYELTGNGAQVNKRPALPAGTRVTSLAAGQSLLVACCASGHPLILKGVQWTTTSVTAAVPPALNGTDLWVAVPGPGTGSETVEESTDGGATWQARPGLPAGSVVRSLALSGDGQTVYALTSAGEVYEAQKGVWYLLNTGLRLAGRPA